MPAEPVPETTRIRTRSLPNVETERLLRRLRWFRTTDHRAFLRALENRVPMRNRAREALLVERELKRRVDLGDPEAVEWAWTTNEEELLCR
jgi:hypothetical protein